MILKVEKIRSIGKFRDFQASGDIAFKKLTLIFADNGSGKTTLTSILRSLTQNKPELVTRRISTNNSSSQAAQIIQKASTGVQTTYTFGPSGWNRIYPNIEIFDIHFVNDNVYSGCDFKDDHKKQLHQFVVGAQGVAIHQNIEKNKSDKTNIRQQLGELEAALIKEVKNGLNESTLNTFLRIPNNQSSTINKKIEEAEANLLSAKSQTIIHTLPKLKVLPNISLSLNFEDLISDFEANLDSIQEEVLQIAFTSHCKDLSKHLVEDPTNWIKTGYDYLTNKKEVEPENSNYSCPFCKRDLDFSTNILRSYSQQFNEVFNNYLEKLKNYENEINSIDSTEIIEHLENIHVSNITSTITWNLHLGQLAQQPVLDLNNLKEELNSNLILFKTAISNKLKSPSNSAQTNEIINFRENLNGLNLQIERYNGNITAYNFLIENFRAAIKSEAEAEAELQKLKRVQLRYTPQIASICNDLTQKKQDLKNLETNYTILVQQQEADTLQFFTTYKSKINYYLTTVFKTHFKIESVEHVRPQGRATQSKLEYTLTIDGKEISFDNNEPHNIKDCLSEGDKSTVALAFFLSKLDIDPNKSDKILIFDDPLSSLDSNRRSFTIRTIKRILPEIKQAIVLSHNEFFLFELYKDIPASDKKALRITEDFLNKASRIEPLLLESLVENDYFKHVKELEKFLQNADITRKETVLGWMRNVLEAHIRFKFYRQTLSIPANNRTFGRLITALENNNVVFRQDQDRGIIFENLKLINSISCKPHHGEPEPDFESLGINPNTISVVELAHYVQETLDLIDNKL